MKISFPRHIVYTSIFTIVMIIFSVWFALEHLVPMGKEYRVNRIELKKEQADLERYENFYETTLQTYNKTKQKNRPIIEAFDNSFDKERFQKQYAKFFINLSVTKSQNPQKEKWYEIYEVNTTSQIKSPKSFYDFLDAINKSPWIVGVTFPINFVREGELIHSSFKMKVYKKSDTNTTATKK